MKRGSPLLFTWDTHDRSLVRMGLSMIVTVTAIVGMFIVFRVVTPESRPVDVRPQQVMLLNPAVPAELALIHQAMDRSFGLLPSETAVAGPLKSLQLPSFVPSFTRHELRLKPLPSDLTTSTQARPFALEMDLLPELPKTAVEKPRPVVASVLKAVIEGEAASRAPQQLEIPDVPLADASRPRFQVAVGSLGQVLTALPLTSSDDAEINQKLHHAVTRMRFAPAQKETEWVQVSFRWEGGKAP